MPAEVHDDRLPALLDATCGLQAASIPDYVLSPSELCRKRYEVWHDDAERLARREGVISASHPMDRAH